MENKKSLFIRFLEGIANIFLFFIPCFLKSKKNNLKSSKNKDIGLPYIVNIENKGSKDLFNVQLFGAYDNLVKNNFEEDGSYVKKSLKISSSLPDITYKDILHSFAQIKFKAGLTYIQSSNQKQILQPFKIIQKNISGDLSENISTLAKDPHQYQEGIIALEKEYEINGFTTLIIPVLKAKTSVTYHFYPTNNFDGKIEKQNVVYLTLNKLANIFKKKETPVVKKSRPYVIEVINTNEESIKDVSIFNSYANLKSNENRHFDKDNNLVSSGVLIKSLNPNISYVEMLSYITNNPFSVGIFYIMVLDGNINQILANIKIKCQDANGNETSKTIVPILDPYQCQNNVLCNYQEFRIDGFTEFVITELQPKTSIIYQIYPKTEIV